MFNARYKTEFTRHAWRIFWHADWEPLANTVFVRSFVVIADDDKLSDMSFSYDPDDWFCRRLVYGLNGYKRVYAHH